MFHPFQQKPEEYLIGVFEIRIGGDLWYHYNIFF